jgi:hypothetical protein
VLDEVLGLVRVSFEQKGDRRGRRRHDAALFVRGQRALPAGAWRSSSSLPRGGRRSQPDRDRCALVERTGRAPVHDPRSGRDGALDDWMASGMGSGSPTACLRITAGS